MTALSDMPDFAAGVRRWLETMPAAQLDAVVAELQTAAAALRLAEAVRAQRRVDAWLSALVGEALVEVDSTAFVASLHSTGRAHREQGGPEPDPLGTLAAAYQDARREPKNEEDV